MANNIAVAVTADVADLTAKMAVAKATMQDVGKAMREVARDVAAGDTSTATKTRLLEVSDAYSKASAQAENYTKQMRSQRVPANDVVAAAGQQKFAMRDLAYQMQDLGVGFSMAAQSSEPFKMAMMTITQQSSQVLSAIQLMRGEAGGFIGFLGGPWGAAIMAAGSVIANLAVAHFSAGKAADVQKDSEEDLSKSLEVLHDKAVQATASIEDGIRASIGDAIAKRAQANETLKAAEAELALARAKSASAGASVSIGAPGYSNTFNVGESAKQDALAGQAQARIDKLRASINSGTETIKGFQAEIARIHIDQQFDAGAAASARYSQRVSDLAKSYRDGRISLDEYARSVYAARTAEKQAEDAAKADAKHPKAAHVKDDSKAREREADRIAKEAARSAEQAALDEVQSLIAANRQKEAIAEDSARTDIQLSQIALQSKLANINAEQRAGTISGKQAIQQRAQVNAQLESLDQKLEQQLFNAKLKELTDNQKNYAKDSKEFQNHARQIELLNKQHLNRMSVLKAQADAKQRQADRILETESNRRMQGMAGTWAQNLARMATLQQGFSATVQGLWHGIANVVAGVIEQMLEKWITAELIKIGLIKLSGQGEIAAEAAKAGAGGVASMAAAPFPINLGAPEFGAAMYAAAQSFSMAGLATGTNELPNDMIAQIHAGERIIPKADNDALIELTKRGAGMSSDMGSRNESGGVGGGGGPGGWPIINISALDGHSVKRVLMDNRGVLADALRKYTRDGGR